MISGSPNRLPHTKTVRGGSELAGPSSTAEFDLDALNGQVTSTMEPSDSKASEADDPDRNGLGGRSRSQASSGQTQAGFRRIGQPSRATTSSSGWAKGAWGSFTRRGTSG